MTERDDPGRRSQWNLATEEPVDALTIQCFYSCPKCGLQKVAVDVRARQAEGLADWWDTLLLALADDHRRRSPGCHPKTLTNVMIPMTGTEQVGKPTPH